MTSEITKSKMAIAETHMCPYSTLAIELFIFLLLTVSFNFVTEYSLIIDYKNICYITIKISLLTDYNYNNILMRE